MGKGRIKVWGVRIVGLLLALALLAVAGIWLFLRGSLAQLEGTVRAPGLSGPVTVGRDARGVPLIKGTSRDDLAYATGYVHAQERFFQMDLLRRLGAGELSELFGEKAVPLDQRNRLHRFRARAEAAVAAMPAPERRMLERYVAGVNAGLGALRSRPFEYALIRTEPRPWSAADSLLVVCAMYFDLQDNLGPRELARGWLKEHSTSEQLAFLLPEASHWDVPLDGAALPGAIPIPAQAPSWWGRPRKEPAPLTASNAFVDSVGSNNWAVAGSRSAHGGAIVADDMHLGLQLPAIWYRLALEFTDEQGKPRRTVGVTLPGALPVVVAGSNGQVAWGFTNSYGDYLDLIALESDPTRPGQVRTPRGWETPVERRERILVKGGAAQEFTVRETSFGPIVQVRERSYALHWLAHQPQALNSNPRKLETVDSVGAALDLAPTLGIPSQNIVVGDAQGNIGWTIAGMLPRRPPAAQGSAATYPIAADGATFDGVLAPQDYPRIVNPADGQLATANSRQLAGAGAQLIGDGGFDLGARQRQVAQGLRALGPKTDVAGVYGIALDDRALFVGTWRERALAVLDQAALKDQPQRAEFLRLLKTSWDGRASVDSVGFRLARNFMWGLHDLLYGAANEELAVFGDRATMAAAGSRWPAVVARLIDENQVAWLPPGHADWRAVQLAAIDLVIAELTRDGKALADASWGARNTAAIAHPIARAAPALKRWLSAPADPLPGDANMPRVAGPGFGQSERMVVAPGREEEGVFNMPGGQSGHPLSPFFMDGHAEWVKGTPGRLLPGPAVHVLKFEK